MADRAQELRIESRVGGAAAADRLRAALFGTPVATILHLGLLASLVVLALSIPHFTRDGSEDFVADVFQHAHVFVWLMVLTILGRTLSLRTIAAFFFIGTFAAVLAVQITAQLAVGVTGTGRAFDSLLVPVLEEAVKAIPLVALFWFLSRRGWQPSITDGLILGFVLGAGMAIHEDALYGRVYGEGTGNSILHMLFPTMGSQSTLSRVEVNGFFHSGWGSVLGLAIGAWFILRHRTRWAFLIGIAGYLVVTLDHAIGNYIIENEGVGGWGLLWALNLDGMLPVYLLLLGIPAAVLAEVAILRSVARRDTLYPAPRLGALVKRGFGLEGLLRIQAWRNYSRARRALHYLLWAAPGRAGRDVVEAQADRVEVAARSLGVPAQPGGARR